MIDSLPRAGAPRSRVLLLGEASARPDGLERALARAGFIVTEGDPSTADGSASPPAPDAVLVTAALADESLARILDTADYAYGRAVPRLVALATEDREAPTRALALGADDAVAAPIHLPELCARLAVRIAGRSASASGPGGQLYDAMADLVEEVCTSLRAEEVLGTLVERLGRALDLSRCSFVLTPPGADHGRVIAESRGSSSRDFRLDLARYPEIREALRTAQPVMIGDVQTDPLFADVRQRWAEEALEVSVRGVVALPVNVAGAVAGVFLLRTREAESRLSPAQVAFAENLVRAAARILERVRDRAPGRPADPLTACATADLLDDRIREEFDRARRYALSFSLVLFDIEQLRSYNERLGSARGDQVLADIGLLLRTGLRAPDFVCRYSGDEFAVLLPETSLPGARQSVNRVRERLGAYPFPELDPGDRPRLSAGIVTFPHPAADQVGDLFALAEAALLRAKGQGGDRVASAEAVAT